MQKKKMFEKSARIFSRRQKQTTFSDAGFLGILRVKAPVVFITDRSVAVVLVLIVLCG